MDFSYFRDGDWQIGKTFPLTASSRVLLTGARIKRFVDAYSDVVINKQSWFSDESVRSGRRSTSLTSTITCLNHSAVE